jgi:AIPR protein
VIATEDEEIINPVITATNRQTQATTEDLYALGAFQKKLEALFSAYPDKKRLYYERRSKQYNAVPDIEKVRIITKPQQIRAFAAMFLDDPHRASRYYADLRAQVGDKIFNERHKLEPYYRWHQRGRRP